jgi:hypothetical protein
MDDQELLRQFENGMLPKEQWTHRAHVKVAYLYLCAHGFEGALAKLRAGIPQLNAAHGVEESPTRGYHETTTHAFLHLVDTARLVRDGVLSITDAEHFCDTHPHLLDKSILGLFYSPERRSHPDAKHRFIEPDLAPLPNRGIAG